MTFKGFYENGPGHPPQRVSPAGPPRGNVRVYLCALLIIYTLNDWRNPYKVIECI